MQEHMNIPSQLHVGFQTRSDTYTGKLGYVIYTDEKGKRRKEGSWEGWRSKDIDPLDVENVPTSGFVLNRKAGGVGSGWGWNDRVEKVRVYDPRDFEFEISIPNLLFILSECNAIKGKGLEGEFVYAWNGTELILLPVTSQEYITSTEFTSAKSMKVTKADMVEGAVYLHKDMRELVYIGRHDYRDMNKHFWDRDKQLASFKASMKKSHVFYDIEADTFVNERGFTKLAKRIGTDEYPDYANLYSRYMGSAFHDKLSHREMREVEIDMQALTDSKNVHEYNSVFEGQRILIQYDDSDELVLLESTYRYNTHYQKHATPFKFSKAALEKDVGVLDYKDSRHYYRHDYGINREDFDVLFPDKSKLKFFTFVLVMESGDVIGDCEFYFKK